MPYSMNSLPSTSQTWQPLPRAMTGAMLGVLVVALGVGVGAAGDERVQSLYRGARRGVAIVVGNHAGLSLR